MARPRKNPEASMTVADENTVSRGRTKTRVPFGGARLKLSTPEIPGYVQRWISDTPGRLQAALEGGWEFVENRAISVGDTGDGNSDVGSRVSKIVDKNSSGPVRGYLMKIREEWYREDQETKQSSLDKVEADIRGGRHNLGGEPGKTYIPSSGISIKSRLE